MKAFSAESRATVKDDKSATDSQRDDQRLKTSVAKEIFTEDAHEYASGRGCTGSNDGKLPHMERDSNRKLLGRVVRP